MIIEVSTCKSKSVSCFMELCDNGWCKVIEDDGEVCDSERLSTVKKLNGRKLKIGYIHGAASGNPSAEKNQNYKW